MEVLYLLVPLSIAIVFGAIWLFFRMSDSGQFDDMVGPALRVLQDDDAGADVDETSSAAQVPGDRRQDRVGALPSDPASGPKQARND